MNGNRYTNRFYEQLLLPCGGLGPYRVDWGLGSVFRAQGNRYTYRFNEQLLLPFGSLGQNASVLSSNSMRGSIGIDFDTFGLFVWGGGEG